MPDCSAWGDGDEEEKVVVGKKVEAVVNEMYLLSDLDDGPAGYGHLDEEEVDFEEDDEEYQETTDDWKEVSQDALYNI